MPPQPLSRVRPKAFAHFGTMQLVEKPYHAGMVMGVISFAAQTENYWGWVLSDLYEHDRRAVLAMYEAIIAGTAKRELLSAALETKLKGHKLAMFRAALKVWKPVRDRRNQFAHHCWGSCKELPDAILLVDPKDYNAWRVGIFEHLDRIKKGKAKGGRHHRKGDMIDPAKVQVWRPNDLLKELENAGHACQFVFDFLGAVKEGPRGRMRQKLSNHPLVLEELQRLRSLAAKAKSQPSQPK